MPGDFVPVLVLTAMWSPLRGTTPSPRAPTDFVTKPFDQTEVLLRIGNLLRMRAQHLEIRGQRNALEITVAERTRELRENA